MKIVLIVGFFVSILLFSNANVYDTNVLAADSLFFGSVARGAIGVAKGAARGAAKKSLKGGKGGASAPAPSEKQESRGSGKCWPAGKMCWDNNDQEKSCVLNCCSKSYTTAKSGKLKGKDVCAAESACWPEGKICWDNDGPKSCRYKCCSKLWRHNGKTDVCTKPSPPQKAVAGYEQEVDDKMKQKLKFKMESCLAAGAKCWNNGGRDSCWHNCCSKAYYHNGKSDVCAPIPEDGKCFAQYTPCWNSYPPPGGKFYIEKKDGKKVFYPSCFNCCARVTANGGSHWPAWTQYYIGDGTHDKTSKKAKGTDALMAGLEAMNPVQGIIDNLKPTGGRAPRGGQSKSAAVAKVVGRVGIGLATKAIGAAGPVGTVLGAAFNFLFGLFSTLFLPKWDLCD